MRNRQQARRRPGRTARAATVGVLAAAAASIVAVAICGCGHDTGTTKARQAASLATGSAAARAGMSASGDDVLVAALLQDGISQAGQKEWSAATTTFDDVLSVAPHNVYALYNLGLVDQSTGNVPGADDFYQQAIAVSPDYTPALYNLAITQESTDPAKALDLYRKIVAINPQASTAYLRMAFVYARQGEIQHAKAAQAKAVAIDPALGKYPLPAAKS